METDTKGGQFKDEYLKMVFWFLLSWQFALASDSSSVKNSLFHAAELFVTASYERSNKPAASPAQNRARCEQAAYNLKNGMRKIRLYTAIS
jgi:hypothetical protein